jgi:glycosyltransferase involved in cell wall biosynthesis
MGEQAATISLISERSPRRRIALAGGLHVGIETMFRNIEHSISNNPDVELLPVPIASYRRDWIENTLFFLPSSTRGTLRHVVGTRPLFSADIDAIWSLLDIPLLPWLYTRNLRRRVALIYCTDSTPRQLRAFGSHYSHWGGRSDAKFRLREAAYAAYLRRASTVHAWTDWAARSLRSDYGVPESRIHVLPPGVDTSYWRPPAARREPKLPWVLFVGGDFERKGGELLLDVYRERLRGRCELHLVTRPGAVPPESGVHEHAGLHPNEPSLLRLYQSCDVMVIPTRADCFSMAGLEAMSSGLPVVTCPVGGVAELFTDGTEGYFVAPDDGQALAGALESLLERPSRRAEMGAAGRELVARRYDAQVNARRLIDIIDEVIARNRRT